MGRKESNQQTKYLIHIDTISMNCSILYFKGLPSKFLENDAFLFLKTVFILANSADPYEILLFILATVETLMKCSPCRQFRDWSRISEKGVHIIN